MNAPLSANFEALVPDYAEETVVIPPRQITGKEGSPAAEAMLAAVTRNKGLDPLQARDMGSVVVFGVAYDGNPCNMRIAAQGRRAANAISRHPSHAIYGVEASEIGVSDGITMGHDDMRMSLPSREHIADGVEQAVNPRQHIGSVLIGGCDKNHPGLVIGAARVDKPALFTYGGTIMPGKDKDDNRLDVVSAFEAAGMLRAGRISEAEYDDIVNNAIPGPGACGGMYTSNTMTSALEAAGFMWPGTAVTPTIYPEKNAELDMAGHIMHHLLAKDLTPDKIASREGFENGLAVAIALGGSTNVVLHTKAMAAEFGIEITDQDIQKVSDRTPVIANLKPAGEMYASDLHEVGGIPAVMRLLAEAGLLHLDTMTVTGRTTGENLDVFSDLETDQNVIRPLDNPIKPEGHIQMLEGNIASEGAVAKITGENAKTGFFTGKALVFDSEHDAIAGFDKDYESFKGRIIVIRNVGIKGAPGMPEMLAITSMITGAGLDEDCALITDGRFSGGTHGFNVGHVEPEAYRGGRIGLLEDGDKITIDVQDGHNRLFADVSDEEFAQRRQTWERDEKPVIGFLRAYRALAGPAHQGGRRMFV